MTPYDEQMVTIRRADLDKLRAALASAREFLVARDDMNAAVHCDTARYSPLTTVVATAVDTADRLLAPVGVRA